MTPTAAARQWLQADADYAEAKRRRDEAGTVLKEMFRSKGVFRFRGVAYACSTYRQLDAALARKLLGAQVADAEVTRTRETLSAVA